MILPLGKLKRACRCLLQDVYWEVRGRRISNPALPRRPAAFLFVCKGNICRSPAAGQMAAEILDAALPAGCRFASAGLEVNEPEQSPAEAVQAGMSWGVRLWDHRSVRLTASMIDTADMVFAMEVGQLEELRRRFPAHRQRFFLLPLFGNNQGWGYSRCNIRDPYGKSVAEFSRCFRNIRECLHNLKDALVALPLPEEAGGGENRKDLSEIASNW